MMMSDIESNRDDIIELRDRTSSIEKSVQSQAVSIARIDENIKAIRNAVEIMSLNSVAGR